jgi:hypothetical protein
MFHWLFGLKSSPTLLAGDQRSAVRHPCDPEANKHLLAEVGPTAWPALVHDISTSGVGLIVGQRFREGTALPLRLFDLRRNHACPLRAHVVYTVRMPDGHWLTGCSFDGNLRDQELEELL